MSKFRIDTQANQLAFAPVVHLPLYTTQTSPDPSVQVTQLGPCLTKPNRPPPTGQVRREPTNPFLNADAPIALGQLTHPSLNLL